MSSSSTSSSIDSQSLRPQSFLRAHSGHFMSPTSDIVGPSPVTSNGTETTEIEDEEVAEDQSRSNFGPHPQVALSFGDAVGRRANAVQLRMLKTNIPDHVRHNLSEEAVSVIHAPENFQSWVRYRAAACCRRRRCPC